MRRKKICFIHPALMDYRIELFDKINDYFDVTFIFTKQGRGQLNVKEKHLKTPSHWNHKILSTKIIFKNRDLGMLFKLAKEIIFGNYDILIVSNSWYICWILSKITRKKFIFWIEFWYWENTSKFRELLNKFTFHICRHSDAIIATGKKAMESQLTIGVNVNKIFNHPQCSKDYSSLETFSVKKELDIQEKKIILFVGRLVDSKGLDVLLKSLVLVNKKHEDVLLIVVGTGPCEDEYKDLVIKLKLNNVLFVGYTDNDKEKASFYKACDLFVLPAVFLNGAYEPWGLVINEAMAFAKPIVTTDAVGAGFDLVEDGVNGFIVKNRDISGLSEAINNILADEDLMLEMGQKSRLIYEKKNKYHELYETFREAIESV